MNALIVGCSFAKGFGLPSEEKNPNLWTNNLFDKNVQITNLSKTGANNDWIFLETMGELLRSTYDVVIVSWTAIPRFNFPVGLELYSTITMLDRHSIDVNTVGRHTWKKSWLAEIGDRLRLMHNDHWDILKLVKYTNVLLEIQHKRKQSIFFVNALCPWSDNFFERKSFTYPSELDNYTQKLLDIDLRDDSDIILLYDMIHNHYTDYGGINQKYWLNLNQSLMTMKIDTVSPTDFHPGIKSQAVFVSALKPILQQKLNETGNYSY